MASIIKIRARVPVPTGELFESIRLFKSAGTSRGSNDDNNKRREAVLAILYNPPQDYLHASMDWAIMQSKWAAFLRTLCANFDDVKIVPKAGRGHNYDFVIQFLKEGGVIQSVNAEFKHNARAINNLPEYFSPASNKPYVAVSYAEYFYDNYIERLYAISGASPDIRISKEDYLRLIHQDVYSKHPFFVYLYENEGAFFEAKRQLVRESITNFLNAYGSQLDVAALTADVKMRQSGKLFILWDCNDFYADKIRDDELEIEGVDSIKNGNVLVVRSKSGTRHNMLLRWKNHLGVLFPAWQISLTRLEDSTGSRS